MKYFTVHFEGMDKTGKDTLACYFDQFCGHKFVIDTRGLISNIAFNHLYGRKDVSYNIEQDKYQVYVYLTCDEKDRKIRCKLSNEPKLDMESSIIDAAFYDAKNELENAGFQVFQYNTSEMTPFKICQDLLIKMEMLNE